MTKYAGLMTKANIPQSEPLDERQVKNHAGGYSYVIDRWKRLERFLILGSDSNTYYQKARDLTRENAKVVEECWLEDPVATQTVIEQVSVSGRAPKNDPAIFALALGTVSTRLEARQLAFGAVNRVCRTGTHLFQFVATAKALGKGFGRGMKRAVADWYTSKPVDKLAYQVVKYRQREGLTHENLIDMAHPKSGSDLQRSALFDWIIGKNRPEGEAQGSLPRLVLDHIAAMMTTAAAELLPIVRENRDLPWEALPTWANADPEIQKALLPGMGMTAMIRNLGNLTRIGAITPLSHEEMLVVNRLQIEEELKRARVHPMQILVALKTYASGKGMRGKGEWQPSQKIVDALDGAFYKAFQNVEPAGKRFFMGIDVSASMGDPVSGSEHLSCAEAAAALALVTVRTEPWTFVGRFNNGIEPVTFGSRTRLDDVLRQTRAINCGGTDCSLPMVYALQRRMPVDVFVVITDNETWMGHIHPAEALRKYRKEMGIDAKLIVMAMTASPFSLADPKDGGMLDIVGFDTAVPALIADFAKS